MAKIKLTKTELKKQRDALRQFTRFLPTLQLKKQQLQLEMRRCVEKQAQNEQAQAAVMDELASWIDIFGPKVSLAKLKSFLSVREVEREWTNIAGVEIPVLRDVSFDVFEYDLYEEDPWVDDAIAVLKKLVSMKIEHQVIEEQHRRLANELRVTTQRVNLFEKIKIPESKDNIRKIQISLGDMDVAGVVRSKIAKKKTEAIQEAVA